MPFFVLIHYGEIILKGRNRGFFEKVLLVNIKQALGKEFFKTIHLGYGRFILELQDGADLSVIKNRLKQVFGIVNFAFVLKVKSKAEVIEQVGLALVLDKQFTTFKVETKRADKTFALSSQKVNARVGSLIVEKLSKKVDLEKPDLTLFIEITKKEAFLFIEKFKGLGGLPVGSSGRAIALLSGGIDSPVACYLAMKRGLEVIFCHFYSEPFSDKRSVEKAKQIISILSKYQAREKFYLIPFAEIQKEILIKTKEGLRVLLYRRAMVKIAEKIAEKEKAKALITGENLGQVASQTIENISVVEKATNLPIIRPLITDDKQEIIEKAKKIGTYEISILPQQDCCSRFLPKNPETKAQLKDILAEEKKCRLALLIKKSVHL